MCFGLSTKQFAILSAQNHLSMTKYLPILWIILFSVFTIKQVDPIAVQAPSIDGFSAKSAMKHLEIMASERHPMGTEANRKVKNYILDEFNKLGIPTEMFIGHSTRKRGDNQIRIGRTENIIATIKGKSNGKAVMVVGHYDSVLGSAGAADDVHSVACMLEIAKTLKQKEHENDIIFLVTDGEEKGLMGAKAFTEQKDVSQIGVLLNYEARGNSGSSLSFEWSEGNAWLVSQVKKVATRPMANSMSFEIYKNLPNDTDFTFFKKAGINGINHAFIDGFSYYHNPADTPENINQESVQHTGTNMLALTRHFANTDLSVTKTHNATFFSVLGLMIIYPSSWDIFILAFALVFLIFLLVQSFRKNTITVKSFSLAFFLILLSVVISVALSIGLGQLLLSFYPQYDIFYVGQFYNHKCYLVTCIGISILISSLLLRGTLLKSKLQSFKTAALLFMAMLTLVFYFFIPTATYFMLYPTIALSIYYFASGIVKKENENIFLAYLSSIIPFALWLPTTILLFLAFSLKGLPLPTIHICIIIISTMVLFSKLWAKSPIMNYVGLALLLGSLIVGHLTSKPTKERPLPSHLFYTYDVGTNQAKWASSDGYVNIGNASFLDGASKSILAVPYSKKYLNKKTDVKPHVSIPQILMDSLNNNIVQIVSEDEIFSTRFYIKSPSNVKSLYINEQEIFVNRDSDESMSIETFAMIADTMNIRIVKKDISKGQVIGINSNFMSLPVEDIVPENALRTDAYTGIVQEFEM